MDYKTNVVVKYHTPEIPTAASSAVVVQHKARDTRTVVRSWQIVAHLLTTVSSGATFVNV